MSTKKARDKKNKNRPTAGMLGHVSSMQHRYTKPKEASKQLKLL